MATPITWRRFTPAWTCAGGSEAGACRIGARAGRAAAIASSPVLRRAFTRAAWLRLAAHALAMTPMALLAHDAFNAQLGADPVAAITHATGDWALRLLLATLAVTPLRRVTGWAWLTGYRRMLGLHAFAYACAHLATYLVLDLGGYWAQIFDDIVTRPFITVGFLAWLCLLPLAATSTRAAMRRLGRRWGQLHRLIYPIAGLAVLHFLWLVKSDLREPLIYAAVLALLLAARAHRALHNRRAQRGGE